MFGGLQEITEGLIPGYLHYARVGLFLAYRSSMHFSPRGYRSNPIFPAKINSGRGSYAPAVLVLSGPDGSLERSKIDIKDEVAAGVLAAQLGFGAEIVVDFVSQADLVDVFALQRVQFALAVDGDVPAQCGARPDGLLAGGEGTFSKQRHEVDPVFLDTGLGDNQWTRRTGRWEKSRMVTR